MITICVCLLAIIALILGYKILIGIISFLLYLLVSSISLVFAIICFIFRVK